MNNTPEQLSELLAAIEGYVDALADEAISESLEHFNHLAWRRRSNSILGELTALGNELLQLEPEEPELVAQIDAALAVVGNRTSHALRRAGLRANVRHTLANSVRWVGIEPVTQGVYYGSNEVVDVGRKRAA